ncbi:hypothetical protein LIA77_11314 [Sarocladium implicatum]|nr:hypothetical protein LIA77_11314 [Sarocladium implicatum]
MCVSARPSGNLSVGRSTNVINRFHHANMTDSQQVRELYLLNFAGADFIRYLGMMLTFVGIEMKSPFFIRPLMAAVKRKLASVWLDREIRNSMKLIDTELEGRRWLMDTEGPSTPDFVIMYGIELGWKSSLFNIEEFPNAKAFYGRCKEREGWKRAIEKGNGFNVNWVKRFREGS